MPRTHSQGFNKEKLVFLGTAVLFGGGVYYFLISAPISLPDDPRPISTKVAAPAALSVPSQELRPLAYYIEPGNLSHILDPLTNELVNRDRKTPFAPEAGFLPGSKPSRDPRRGLAGVTLPPPPPPPAAPKDKDQKTDKGPKVIGPNDPSALVAFMGVVIVNGETYGLLRPKDGSNPLRVKVGDLVPDIKYKITKIEKQSIWVKDDKDCAFILKDTDENADTADKGGDEDTSDEIDTPAPAKDAKKAAPKPHKHEAKPAKDKGAPEKGAAAKGATGKGAADAPPAAAQPAPQTPGKRPRPNEQQF